jgi:uracil permease
VSLCGIVAIALNLILPDDLGENHVVDNTQMEDDK